MRKLYAWPTLDSAFINLKSSFSYANFSEVNDILKWSSKTEDLVVKVDVEIQPDKKYFEEYLFDNEHAVLILSWRCDNKFTGSSSTVTYFENVQTLNCTIPKGSCLNEIILDFFVVTSPTNSENHIWKRPPGSIISHKPILEKTGLDRGALFPFIEYEGDGKRLIQWDFYNTDDLDISVISGATVILDKRHPFTQGISEYPSFKSITLFMIIQGFLHKAFSDEIIIALKEKESNNEKWRNGSLGGAFSKLLDKVRTDMRIQSLDDLKIEYLKNPENIDTSLYNIFTKTLKEFGNA